MGKVENEKLINDARNNPDSSIYKMMQQIYKWQQLQHQEFEEYMRGVSNEQQ